MQFGRITLRNNAYIVNKYSNIFEYLLGLFFSVRGPLKEGQRAFKGGPEGL